MRLDNLTIDEIDKAYPDILYPSRTELFGAASCLLGGIRILKKQGHLGTTFVGITGGLAVMRYCPDRLPSIAPARNEDIDVVLDLGDSTLEDLMNALHWHDSQHFIKHRETLYMWTHRGKLRIDFKVIPSDRKLPGMQSLYDLHPPYLPFVNKIDLMTSKMYDTHPDSLPSSSWRELDTARGIHHGTDALRLALLFDPGKRITVTARQALRVVRASLGIEYYTGISGFEWLKLFLVCTEEDEGSPAMFRNLEDAFLGMELRNDFGPQVTDSWYY
ncbi:hypothetical protein BO85DRAFT_488723 [Aspergillus piperis CBS 112811]|uniref:Uncharacterized protein n=1 Tax=Aspergillus piperis CBS 112811 TaxID=1448313 RepID=A0A8G1VNZ6_9EURO|nr:hypothetical protein BO85DRAFT_488723 [Aspergillus piperis CBS 112811]RAH57233.1 hypothetical protein BO85DRAFT_488723 [Aspergillus piperis CBS 112811]